MTPVRITQKTYQEGTNPPFGSLTLQKQQAMRKPARRNKRGAKPKRNI